ncbi:SH3 domain-containing protein [Geomicrobium sediminis]|uniref:N-acetylmuramoyl-L-alanine amidase n=1 Tax=Geomicrobium sediminis TaxID=1347788 RepID=A0ABS2P7A9_9BACL|nr:SH3 domain-containing protein [Geomicrobium sediminis]MBM7631295.1 N-acetylmuramoyl-L-alanine amidase [Geomicrobium sediminis]
MRRSIMLFALVAVVLCAPWFDLTKGSIFQPETVEAATLDVPFEGTVAVASALNVRSGPGTTFDRVGQLRNGATVTVVNVHNQGEWYEVEMSNGTGFVHSSYITNKTSLVPEDDSKEVIDRAIVTANTLVVRDQPSGSATILGRLTSGTEVEILEYQENSRWVLVIYNNGVAYTHLDHLQIEEASSTPPPENEGPELNRITSIGIVTHHNLAIRSLASGSSSRLGGATTGDALEVYGEVNGGPWVKVKFNNVDAYTHSNYLTFLDVADSSLPIVERGTVNHNNLAVRISPSGSSERIGTLTRGDSVLIHERVGSGSWVKITYKGGLAYTHRDYLRIQGSEEPPTSPEPPEQIPDPVEELGEIVAKGVVNTSSRLAVRVTPSGSAQSLGHLVNGNVVEIYEFVNGGPWVKIVYDGQVAFTHADHLNVTQVGEAIESASVTHHNLVVRSGPGASHNVIHRLPRGTQVQIYEYVNGGPWVKISFSGGEGYTSVEHLAIGSTGSGPLAGRTIVVDAGHGGRDSGATGNGLVEKTINLQVSRELANRLERGGANVIMTRSNDTFIELVERARIANRASADLFISVHANAFPAATARGAETFYHPNDGPDSRRLATALQNRLVRDTGMVHRRVDPANFSVLRNTNMTASLIELGFVTNAGDASIMRQPGYPARAGEALYQGVLDFYR